MKDDKAAPASNDDGYAWLRDGSVPHSREDRIAETLAMIALVFSLGIGLVIALLPVSGQAAMAAELATASPAPGLGDRSR